MTASDDEYDIQAGGPIELTEQDCAAIDALSATPQDSPSSFNVPEIDFAVLASKTRRRFPLRPSKKHGSPIERYRRNGRLSVSDLVSPAWCELQFEYGLLQRRSGRLEQRPSMFVSRAGKEIRVKEKTAQLNDVVLQEGNAVHSALEREVHPTKVEVATTTQEEHWGLRLFNMISDLQTLMLIGKCREFRVMGFIHDHFISGIIDEITRTPILDNSMGAVRLKKRARDYSVPSTPSKPKPKRTKPENVLSSPSKQLKIDSFFPTSPRKSSRKEDSIDEIQEMGNLSIPEVQTLAERLSHRTHILHLIDSKTRLSPSLPQHSATLSSRLQLMTYKRLLDALLTPAPAFDFPKLWKYLGLNPRRTFSEAFMAKLLLLSPVEEYDARCLKDLETHWWSTVRELGASSDESEQSAESHAPVDSELTLVYRLRGAGPRAKGTEGKHRSKSPSKSSEHEDLKKVILESLGFVTSDSGDAVVSVEMNDRANALEVHASKETQDVLECTLPESLKAVKGESLPEINGNTNSLVSSDPSCDETQLHGEDAAAIPPINAGDIIGQKKFEHDDHMLDAHITNILAWWHGERAPRGVDVEEASRCRTCEYMDGCEWREKKALEASGSDVVTTSTT